MSALAALAVTLPLETLAAGTQLLTEGTRAGQLYILESGRLTVRRDGVDLASIDEPGAIIGEMAVLLGNPHSATVVADTEVRVRVLDDALDALAQSPELALHIATLACARLDATSALLVELRRESSGRVREQALVSRILGALSSTPRPARGPRPNHE